MTVDLSDFDDHVNINNDTLIEESYSELIREVLIDCTSRDDQQMIMNETKLVFNVFNDIRIKYENVLSAIIDKYQHQ